MVHYSKEQKEAFIKEGILLREKGYSYVEIARELGVSRGFISPYLKHVNFESRRTNPALSGTAKIYLKARTNALRILVDKHKEEFYKILVEEKKKLTSVPKFKRISPKEREVYSKMVKELRELGHTYEYISIKIGYSVPTVRSLYFEQ